MPYAAQAAWSGLRRGATHAIVNKPLILLPGVNHGMFWLVVVGDFCFTNVVLPDARRGFPFSFPLLVWLVPSSTMSDKRPRS